MQTCKPPATSHLILALSTVHCQSAPDRTLSNFRSCRVQYAFEWQMHLGTECAVITLMQHHQLAGKVLQLRCNIIR